MKAENVRNMFLSQSYIDSWYDYVASLHKEKAVKWDFVILTASNENQAKTYNRQIAERRDHLPSETHFAVLPDPCGKRVGSGGATLNALRYVKSVLNGAGFKGKRILIIHSGGDSKRVPQYSACGKLFSPIPRILPDGRRSTLFDEFMISMSGIPARMNDGVLVMSGDVLLLLNPIQIDFQFGGAAAISMKVPVSTGKNHGVFLSAENGNVKRFLHKQSEEKLAQLGAVNEHGKVNIDTGAIFFDGNLTEELYSLVDTEENFNKFVNERARLSFYADFVYPLASEVTLEEYYKETPEGEFTEELHDCRTKIWDIMSKYRLKMLNMSPAQFIHFGTTHEFLELLTDKIDGFSSLGWSKRILVNKESGTDAAISNSLISPSSHIDPSSYIEDSYILGECKIGKNCVISNMSLIDEVVEDNTVIHGLKLQDGRFVARKYKIDTNPKINDFWNEKAFCIADSLSDSLHNKTDKRISLNESYNLADTEYIIEWQKQLESEIRISNFVYDAKNHKRVEEIISELGDNFSGDDENAILLQTLYGIAKGLDYSVACRIYYALSKYLMGRSNANNTPAGDYCEDMCFSSIRDASVDCLLGGTCFDRNNKIQKDNVTVEMPVRVNWGGGWTDTPPYCYENGGTVLNASIKLDGRYPIVVNIKQIPELCIQFESEDEGSLGTVKTLDEIQDGKNPFDPFALHKAALIACGIIPYKDGGSLRELLKTIGGGFRLSTCVKNIPRGSGLGTSSILSAACVKALSEFFGLGYATEDVIDRVLCMEQIMSTGGGWQDQIGGLIPGIKFLMSDPGLHQKINVENLALSQDTIAELSERFILIYTGQRRLARNLLREVVGKYISGNEDTKRIFAEIQRKAALMRFELENGDIDRFAELLNEHWELSKELDPGCTNTGIEQIFLSINELIDGKFIAGAGGGGFLQVILKKGVTKEHVQEKLNSVFEESGIDVWNVEFVF